MAGENQTISSPVSFFSRHKLLSPPHPPLQPLSPSTHTGLGFPKQRIQIDVDPEVLLAYDLVDTPKLLPPFTVVFAAGLAATDRPVAVVVVIIAVSGGKMLKRKHIQRLCPRAVADGALED